MASGSVKIQIFKDRLRLVWSWQGKRFWLYIGLPDTIANRKAASIKASQIELDMVSGNFIFLIKLVHLACKFYA